MTEKKSENIEFIKQLQFIQKLKKLSFVKKVILFGSRVRADNKSRSDIDIAIDCPKATSDQWLEVLDIVDQADTLLLIDCVDLKEADEKLKKNILEDGIIL